MACTNQNTIDYDSLWTKRAIIHAISLLPVLTLSKAVPAHAAALRDKAERQEKLLYMDNFGQLSPDWCSEVEFPAQSRIEVRHHTLDIVTYGGATLWYRHELFGPVEISYQAACIDEGGAEDWVSDLNCFWMATDPRRAGHFFSPPRSGAFAGYNALRTYYVGLGGNRNTTTRFRRYIGDTVKRPLLPENDLKQKSAMLVANHWQEVRLIADGSHIQFYRDGVRLFDYMDEHPYTHGYFGIRTTKNHLQIRKLRIYRL